MGLRLPSLLKMDKWCLWGSKVDITSFDFQPDAPFGSEEPVDSSCMESAMWETGSLTINFNDGTSYTYSGVSPLVYANLLRSVSKGWFFNKYIRNSYPFSEN